MKIDAKEAARRIRDAGLHDEIASHMDPATRHRMGFIQSVCNELGVPPDADNLARVSEALIQLDIQPHEGNEYPKYVPTGRKEQVYDPGRGDFVDGKKDEMVIV